MGWTYWRTLARGSAWDDASLCYEGPAVYELGLSKGRRRITVYVGETKNERRRLSAYGSHGSHLGELIAWHLRRGWQLNFRAIAVATKRAAKALQDRLLARYEYPWNTVGVPRGD